MTDYIEQVIEEWERLNAALAALNAWAGENDGIYEELKTHPAALDIIASTTGTELTLYNQALYVKNEMERVHITLVIDMSNKPAPDAIIRENIQTTRDKLQHKLAILRTAHDNQEMYNNLNKAIMGQRKIVEDELGELDRDTFRILHTRWPALFGLLTSF